MQEQMFAHKDEVNQDEAQQLHRMQAHGAAESTLPNYKSRPEKSPKTTKAKN